MQQQSNSFHGLILAGRLVGVRKDERKGNDGQPWIRHFIGIESPVHNGFPGQTQVDEIQVGDKAMDAQFYTNLEKFHGKDVFVRVYLRVYATKAGAGHQYNLSNQPDNILLQPVISAKAA